MTHLYYVPHSPIGPPPSPKGIFIPVICTNYSFKNIYKKCIFFYISNRNFNPEIKLTHFVQATNQARLCLTVQN